MVSPDDLVPGTQQDSKQDRTKEKGAPEDAIATHECNQERSQTFLVRSRHWLTACFVLADSQTPYPRIDFRQIQTSIRRLFPPDGASLRASRSRLSVIATMSLFIGFALLPLEASASYNIKIENAIDLDRIHPLRQRFSFLEDVSATDILAAEIGDIIVIRIIDRRYCSGDDCLNIVASRTSSLIVLPKMSSHPCRRQSGSVTNKQGSMEE